MPITSKITPHLPRFSKIPRDGHMATPTRSFAILDQRLQTPNPTLSIHVRRGRRSALGYLSPARPALVVGFVVPLLVRARHHIRRSVPVFAGIIQDTEACVSIPTRSSRFLVKALERLGDLPVHYETHVFFIYAHAESCRGDYDVVPGDIGYPALEMIVFLLGAEAGVVRFRAYTVLCEAGSERFAVLAVERVDDAWDMRGAFSCRREFCGSGFLGAARVHGLQPGEEVVVVVCFVGFETDFVVEIRARGCHCKDFQFSDIEIQSLDDVVTHALGGGCCTADYGDVRELVFEPIEFLKRGPEVVAPF